MISKNIDEREVRMSKKHYYYTKTKTLHVLKKELDKRNGEFARYCYLNLKKCENDLKPRPFEATTPEKFIKNRLVL